MIRKRVGGLLAALAVAVLALALPAAPAQAAGAPFDLYASTKVDGMPSNFWPSVHCANTYEQSYTPALGCFKETGDLFFAQDMIKDGYSAMLYFEVPSTGRNGACVNSYGAGTTGRCDLNIGEGRWMCIYTGIIDMNGGFAYRIFWDTKECFYNNE